MREPPGLQPESSDEAKSGVLNWFSKTKQSLTGGSANVYVCPERYTVAPGEKVEFRIDVRVAEFELAAKGVVLEVVAEELVVLPWHTVRQGMGAKFDGAQEAWNVLVNSGKFSHRESTFSGEFRVSDAITWKARAKGQLSAAIVIPAEAVPSFHGRTIASQWRARAVVQTSAVDPKSDWVVFEVAAR